MATAERRPVGRCVAVGLGVSAVAAAMTALALPAVRPALDPAAWRSGAFDVVLTGIAAAALLLCAAWLWVVTALTLVDIARDSVRTPSGRLRRLVLSACGVAFVAGVAVPAHASEGESPSLSGLPLPDRAVGTGVSAPRDPTPRVDAAAPRADRPTPVVASGESITVRGGDSLWALAARQLGPGATAEEIDSQWRRLYDRNRSLLGHDPDLIHPGQRLTVPHPTPAGEENPR